MCHKDLLEDYKDRDQQEQQVSLIRFQGLQKLHKSEGQHERRALKRFETCNLVKFETLEL